jgi:hypothetical protein
MLCIYPIIISYTLIYEVGRVGYKSLRTNKGVVGSLSFSYILGDKTDTGVPFLYKAKIIKAIAQSLTIIIPL